VKRAALTKDSRAELIASHFVWPAPVMSSIDDDLKAPVEDWDHNY
jgi:hypothetical protein